MRLFKCKSISISKIREVRMIYTLETVEEEAYDALVFEDGFLLEEDAGHQI